MVHRRGLSLIIYTRLFRYGRPDGLFTVRISRVRRVSGHRRGGAAVPNHWALFAGRSRTYPSRPGLHRRPGSARKPPGYGNSVRMNSAFSRHCSSAAFLQIPASSGRRWRCRRHGKVRDGEGDKAQWADTPSPAGRWPDTHRTRKIRTCPDFRTR